jgi:Na+/proline symporter
MNEMLAKGLVGVIFAAGFGVVFIVAGLKRIFSRTGDSRRADSIIWGAFGVALGAAILVGVAWFVFGPQPPPDSSSPLDWPGN